MKAAISVFISALLFSCGLAAQEHPAGTNVPCEKNSKSTTQLPLVPNPITLHFPRAWISVSGTWHIRSSDGTVLERCCEVGNKGPCASASTYDAASPCLAGSIDLAMKLGLGEPGTYILEWISREGSERIGPITLNLEEPRGMDREAYEKVLVGCLKEHQAHYGGNLMGGAFVCLDPNHFQKILNLFPTSTYAGYALVDGLSGIDLQFHSTMTSADRDRFMNLPDAAPKARQEEWRRSIKKKEEAKLSKLMKFMEAHPDFVQIDRLHKAAAILLFVLDRSQEAWLEVEALAKLSGPWAEEARKVLENRKQDCAKPTSAPPTAPTSEKAAPAPPAAPAPAKPPVGGS